MQRLTISIAIAVLICLLFSVLALGEVPQIISYQGRLTDPDGNPVPDDDYLITFRIWDDPISTAIENELWNSDYREIQIIDGMLSYTLGDTVPIPVEIFSTNEDLYLGIKVGTNDEITPRIRLTSAAYAIHSLKSDSSGFALLIADNSVTSAKIQDASIQLEDIGQNGASDGQVMKWNESVEAWEPANDIIGGNWSVVDSVLYTDNYWGIARGGAGNVLYGDSVHTMVNLGVACTTGIDGSDHKYATVGGGYINSAKNWCTTISGGKNNTASEVFATVGGGNGNLANGYAAAIPGGLSNIASGFNSFAAGYRAQATHSGSFAWADYNVLADPFNSVAGNGFHVRASGGVYFYTNGSLTSGTYLPSGGSIWETVCDSTLKRNIREVDYHDIVDKVMALPVSQWSFKSQEASIEHVGPMAQDFHRLFGLGEDDKHLTSIDLGGISLAAIKGLYEMNRDQRARIDRQAKEISALKDELLRLTMRIEGKAGIE